MTDEYIPNTSNNGKPLVRLQNGQVFADSRDVAAHFGKEHKSVLRSIRELHCSEEFRLRNFAPFKINDLSGESISHVEMTRDGFTFLAMGFTGSTAGAWKERYIEAFRKMEEQLLKSPVLNQFDMMRAVIDNLENNNQRLFSVENAIENFGAHEDYRTIKAHAAHIGCRLSKQDSAALGRLATSLSKQRKVKMGTQVDETYGHVNTYHRDILEEIFKK